MRSYLLGRCAEFSHRLERAESIISCGYAAHKELVASLQSIIEHEKKLVELLRRTATLQPADEVIQTTAFQKVHTLEMGCLLLQKYALALLYEDDDEIRLGRLILRAAQEIGLLIEDIVVARETEFVVAISPRADAFPLIYVPLEQPLLATLPPIYHEMGHILAYYSGLHKKLQDAVLSYFSEQQRQSSPLTTVKDRTRQQALDKAKAYWGIEVVDEVFSDLFAAFAGGPASFCALVDVAIRQTSGNPFTIVSGDPHPPMPFRVATCWEILRPGQRSGLAGEMKSTWDLIAKGHREPPEYPLCCPATLAAIMSREADELFTDIGVVRYGESNPSSSIAKIINEAITRLIKHPGEYDDWDRNAKRKLLN